ncbi:MFS transporter [Phytoactinopolyspora mesophila]|uniref:MFS transporter n=1 Tax=Phytoactinopolyspora mesophila TaxID=2650750 RepID=A0A7K3M9R3_9ACTN|nr:MFS transporter [Phytoactinopolyspora mesophila]NDL60065.1 MFS transporter [Phytoactinopolyspora mesophila]
MSTASEAPPSLWRNRDYTYFVFGHATSIFGNAMATVVLAFAVLAATGSLTNMGLVLAARIVPLVLFLLVGGVIGDRLPRRLVMVAANIVRASTQTLLALALLTGFIDLWVLLGLSFINGIGEAVFTPAYNSLTPSLVHPEKLSDANAFLNVLNSVANVAGPATAAVLVQFIAPASVLLIGAGCFVPSILALLIIRPAAQAKRVENTSVLTDLREGWRAFSAHTWLWTITVQFTMFNLVLWAPYLVLGPATADRHYGGAGPWGIVLALFGAGAAAGGLALMVRKPRRPLLVATIATFTWTAPCIAIALIAPIQVVVACAFIAGVSSALFNTLVITTVQRRVPPESLSRVMSYVTFGAYSVGPIGLAIAGPIAEATSIAVVLGVGVICQLTVNSIVLAVPSVRRLRS